MTSILDQQFIAHVYAPADGPDADAARRALTAIWQGCALTFQMGQPIPGIGLPATLGEPLLAGPDGEFAVAAQERRSGDFQAIVRRHHDVWNLSVAIAPAQTPDDLTWWRSVDARWNALTGEHAPHLIGEARLYLARLDAADEIRSVSPGLVAGWDPLLPGRSAGPESRGARLDQDIALWEIGDRLDERPLRRFMLALGADADPAASAWVWSRGDTAIPPLARYLLHAAKLRYELRVWQRDDRGRELREALEGLGAEIVRLGGGDAAMAELLRLRRSDAALFAADLGALRHTVEIAADNLARAFDRSAVLVPGGPFADDADLAATFLERLDDEVAYLGHTADRATGLLDLPPRTTAADPSRARKVFVVHGRDEPARVAAFELLVALGLEPVDWDEAVAATGEPMPFLGQVLLRSMPMAQAVVVVMTPDDIVRLHPDLHGGAEPVFETTVALQARPNVLIELGMALAIHPRATLMLGFGDHRPIADLGGFNYVRIEPGAEFRRRIGTRLRLAGCPVHMPEDGDWRTAGGFETLAAVLRAPTALPDTLLRSSTR